MLAAMAGVGCALVACRGLPERFPPSTNLTPASAPGDSPDQGWRNGVCFFLNVSKRPNWSSDRCTLTPPASQSALLWGDSYAAHYTPGIEANADHIPYRVYQYTMAGCPPVLSYYSYARPGCTAFNRQALDIIRSKGIRTVVLSGRWVDLRSRGFGQLKSTLDALDALGVKTYIIGQSPDFLTDVDVIALRDRDETGRQTDRWVDAVEPGVNAELRTVAGRHSFIDPLQALCQDERCLFRVRGRLLFHDSGHLSPFGSDYAVRKYFPLYTQP